MCLKSITFVQGKPGILLAAAECASDARVMLEALETGTHGVVLRTEDPAEARSAQQCDRQLDMYQVFVLVV
jgi:3-dehydroquinate synthase class II